jgi:hypothetical protein
MSKSIETIEKERKEKQLKELNDVCEPIAEEIVQVIAKHKPSGKVLKHHEYLTAFTPIQQELTLLFLKHNLTISQVNYTFTIVQGIMDQAKRLTNDSIQTAFERAQRKLFKVEDVSGLTLSQIDDILKSEA